MNLTAIFIKNRQQHEERVDESFVASMSPLYLGLIIKPSAGLWEHLKSADRIDLGKSGVDPVEFKIAYRIEVGENTIFFVTPSDSSRLPAAEKLVNSDE